MCMVDISIIIPIFNVEDYIERCILSVMCQECKGISIECILIDDKSPDGSIDKAIRLIEDYSGNIVFKVVKHEQNQGQSAARNTGIKYATGKYLFFLDSDDDLLYSCIKKLWNVVLRHPDIQLVMGNFLDKRTGGVGINNSRISRGVLNNYQLLEMFFLKYIPVMPWNCLILKDIIVNNNLSFKTGLLQEDMLWSSQLFRHIDKFYFVSDVTLSYEYNPTSIMSVLSNDETRHIPHQLYIIKEFLNTFRKDHCVSNTLYIMSELLLVLDIIWKNDKVVEESLVKTAFDYRNELFKISLANYRFLLSLYELIMFNPFRYILKYRPFRRNYHRISIALYNLASAFDKLHRR